MDDNKKHLRENVREGALRFIKSIRIPLITVAMTFFTALVVIPLLMNGSLEIRESLAGTNLIEFHATPAAAAASAAPEATPLATPAPTETAASDEAQAAAIEPTPEPTLDPESIYFEVQPGEKAQIVKDIQLRLMELCYMEGDEPTDLLGPVTEEALKRFQHMHYMNETGVADALTQLSLFSENAKPYVLKKGDDGEDVLKLQKRLDELGFYEGKQNGYFGVATARALSAFLVKNGEDATAEADYTALELVYSPHALPAYDPTPTPKPKSTKRATATPSPTKKASSTSSGWVGSYDVDNTPNVTAKPTDSVRYTPDPVISNGSVEDFIAVALNQCGKPYVSGAEGPDAYDCSGLVYYALKSVGVGVGRYSASGFSQVASWETISSKSDLRRGDLLFYNTSGRISHVAIWLGGNSIVHASASRASVCTTTWGSWSDSYFVFAKRVF